MTTIAQDIAKPEDAFGRINFMPWTSMSRLPMIHQNETAECGLACIAMISAFYGGAADLASLRSRIGVGQEGVNLKQLMAQADRAGLSVRVLRAELGAFRELKLPCVLHWDMNHFVVLKKVGKKKIVVHDPRIGVVEMSYDEASSMFSGIALEMFPNDAFEKETAREVPTLRSIMGRTIGLKGALLQVFCLALLLQLIGLISPAAMQWLVDNGLTSSDHRIILTIVGGMALLLATNLVIGTVRSWMLAYLTITLGFRWSSRVANHLLHLPVDFFERRHLGDILSRFGSVSAIQQTITAGLIEGVLDGLLGVCVLVMMWIYSPIMAVTALISVGLLCLLQILVFEKSKRISNESMLASARVSSNFMESIRGIRAIKLHGRENYRHMAWQNLSVESINVSIRQQWLGIVVGLISSLISGAQRIVAIYLAARFISAGSFTIGMLFAYLSYQDQFVGRASNLVSLFFNFRMLRLHFERLADIVLTRPEQISHFQKPASEDDAPQARDLPAHAEDCDTSDCGIEFDRVSFKYSPYSGDVLSDLSFSTRGRGCTVIVGRSGAGKTTIAKLALGIHAPSSGTIRVNGALLNEGNLGAIRGVIGCVLQDDSLFAGSIRENIAFFDERIDQERIEECARNACIHDDIVAMPMGYQTLIGDMGSLLSAGQKQRILIARALYRKPKVLLLDEATSHLDVATEEALNRNLAALDLHRVYIAHRPQTIKFGEQVIEV